MSSKNSSQRSWTCPDCGRRFPRETRLHSCSVSAVATHLERASPEVREAFLKVQRLFENMGPLEVVPLKTMITFRITNNFAAATVTKSRVDLGFFLPRELRHPRIQKIERLSSVRFAHHVHLTSPADVDAELSEWLRESYAFARSASK